MSPLPYERDRLEAAPQPYRPRDRQRALICDGFTLRSTGSAHQRYRHPDGRRVTVSFHSPGETFAPKTLRSMIELQARWTEDDLRRLKLSK